MHSGVPSQRARPQSMRGGVELFIQCSGPFACKLTKLHDWPQYMGNVIKVTHTRTPQVINSTCLPHAMLTLSKYAARSTHVHYSTLTVGLEVVHHRELHKQTRREASHAVIISWGQLHELLIGFDIERRANTRAPKSTERVKCVRLFWSVCDRARPYRCCVCVQIN